MREHTGRAVLDSIIEYYEITAAFSIQKIQRAVAKQAVELFGLFCSVAGKVLTRQVLEKSIMFPLPSRRLTLSHSAPPVLYFSSCESAQAESPHPSGAQLPSSPTGG